MALYEDRQHTNHWKVAVMQGVTRRSAVVQSHSLEAVQEDRLEIHWVQYQVVQVWSETPFAALCGWYSGQEE